MAYEKHEWVNNETITASKLNNIEDGIEEAAQSGGGGALIVAIRTNASGYNSSSHQFGRIVYAIKVNGAWVLMSGDENVIYIAGFDAPVPEYRRLQISEDVGAFLIPDQADRITTTGGISDTPESLYYDYGSLEINCYQIAGSGEVVFIAD